MAKQAITSDKAVVRKRQHKAPCSDCPWRRDAIKGWLGPLDALSWLALAHSEGEPGCHTVRDKACAGMAVYRANVYKVPRDPDALRLPPDPVKVFTLPAEFERHHEREPVQRKLRPSDMRNVMLCPGAKETK